MRLLDLQKGISYVYHAVSSNISHLELQWHLATLLINTWILSFYLWNLMIRLIPQAYRCSVALKKCLCNSHWGFVCYSFIFPLPKLICWRAQAIISRYSQGMTAGLCHPLHTLICSQHHTQRELPALDPGKATGKILLLGAVRLVGLPWWFTLCSKL